jgi:hypothetical protein
MIYGGESSNSITYAVYSIDGADPIIEGNFIHGGQGDNTYGVHNSTDSDSTIVGNTIHGGVAEYDAYGISNFESSPKIWNNTIFGGESKFTYSANTYGIFCHNAGTALIYNNTIDGGSGDYTYGIRFGEVSGPGLSATPDIRNNIIYNSCVSHGYCIFEASPSGVRPLAVQDNDLWDPDDGSTKYYAYRASNPTTYYHATDMTAFNNLNWGTPDRVFDNFSDDPVFIDADGADGDISEIEDNDWHLTPDPPGPATGSPWSVTVGGQNLSANFTKDKDGIDRTGSWSVGAYEFDPF